MIKKIFIGLLLLVVLLVGAITAFVMTFDLDSYRTQIEARATDAIGREVRLSGHMSLSFWPSLGIRIEDVSVANPTWAKGPYLLTAGTIDLSVAVMPLLHRRIEVERVLLENIDLALEEQASGTSNWHIPLLDKEESQSATGAGDAAADNGAAGALSMAVSQITLSNVRFSSTKERAGKPPMVHEVTFDRVTIRAPKGQRVGIDAAGTFAGERFNLGLRTGSLDEIQQRVPFSTDLTVSVVGSELQLQGTVDMSQGLSADMNFAMRGDRFADLSRIIVYHPPLPEGAPYRFIGHVRIAKGYYQLSDLLAEFGHSQLGGNLQFTLVNGRPELGGTLTSDLLDPADFALPPADPSVDAEGRATGARSVTPGPVVIPWQALNIADADLKLDLRKVQAVNGPLGSIKAAVKLSGGRLIVQPVTAQIGGGAVDGHLYAESIGQFDLGLKAAGVDYGAVLDALGRTKMIEGRADATINLRGRGATSEQVLAGLNGRITVDSGNGQLLTRYLQGEWLDKLRQASPVPLDFESTVMNCLVSNIDIVAGVATVTNTMLDTDKLTLAAAGRADLGRDQVEMVMRARPNTSYTAGLSAPIKISGALSQPTLTVDPQGLAQGIGDLVGVNLGGFRVPVNTEPHGGAAACRKALAQAGAAQNSGASPTDNLRNIIQQKAGSNDTLKKLPNDAGKAVRGLLDRLSQ